MNAPLSALTPATSPAPRRTSVVGPDKIRVGLVGIGNWAQRGHLPVLKHLGDFELVAVFGRDLERTKVAAARFGIRDVMLSSRAVAEHPDVDLVLILTTAPQHEAGVREAIAAGKDVYCEWPLTTDSSIARELLDLANAAGVRHLVGLQRRLAPTSRYVRDLMSQGYVGRMRSVRLHVSVNYFQARLPKSLQWTVPPGNFSNVVSIYAGHFLDMVFAMVGTPLSLNGLTANHFKAITIIETGEVIPTTNPDQLVLLGELRNGAVFSFHVEGGKRNNSGVQLDITGDEGDLRISNVSAFGEVGDDYLIEGAHGDDLPLEILTVPESYGWFSESALPSSVLELANLYSAYSRHVKTGEPNIAPTFDDALWLHEFLDEVTIAAETGLRRLIELPPS